jgi:recombination protein RecR
MRAFPKALSRLVQQLSGLPTIGERSANRIAYHLVTAEPKLAEDLVTAISQALAEVRLCQQCFFLSDQEVCSICANSERDTSLVCVVEKPMDLIAIERAGEFRGNYHVLHGLWSPLRGKELDSSKLNQLEQRCKNGIVKEVILATSATVEGDATALYLSRLLSEHDVRVTRLAQGLPKGGELEYLDDFTLSKALAGRSNLN